MVNHVKRNSLKKIANAAAGVAVVGMSPLSFAATGSNQAQAAISITHVETVFGRTIFIENISNEVAKLDALDSGVVSSRSGEFDINGLLSDGGLEIQPATTQAHNISADGRVHNWAVWQSLESAPSTLATSGRTRPVNVKLHDHL